MEKTFSNKYGTLTVSLSNPYHVSEIRLKNIPDQYSIDILEKVALITDNKNIQEIFDASSKLGAFVVHDNSNTVRVAKIVSIKFPEDINPTKELDRLVKSQLQHF